MDEIEQEFSNIIQTENGHGREEQVLDDRDIMNELFGDEPEPLGEEAIEVPERTIKMVDVVAEDVTKVKKPRRVLLKLDLEKLFSDRGLSAIPNHINPLKFKGKGHELEDITTICRAYEHWAHRLYPKMTFKDVLEKVEALGLKNRKKCFNHRMEIYENARRLSTITGKDANEDEDDDDVAFPDPVESDRNETDVFGSESSTLFGDTTVVPVQSSQPPAPKTSALSEEQIERMRQNRLRAIQKKKERESGVGVNNPLEMSPLARSDEVPMKTSCELSSDSDCQAPSKRFKRSSEFSSPPHDRTDTSYQSKSNISELSPHLSKSPHKEVISDLQNQTSQNLLPVNRDHEMLVIDDPNMDAKMSCHETLHESNGGDVKREIESLIG